MVINVVEPAANGLTHSSGKDNAATQGHNEPNGPNTEQAPPQHHGTRTEKADIYVPDTRHSRSTRPADEVIALTPPKDEETQDTGGRPKERVV